MAKRKRLTPPDVSDTARAAPIPPLETKAMFPSYPMGVAPSARSYRAAPIADVASEAATVAALEQVSDTLARARREGRMVLELALDQVDEAYLVRDRVVSDPEEMAALLQSLRLRGQQSPIDVADLGEGRYGLISGWRRLTALRQLAAEQPEKTVTVLALLRQPEESGAAYLAMVEENEIRVGLSYFERARIAAKACAQGAYGSEKAALLSLYHAASRAKRSKIRSFLTVVAALDGHLRFPAALGERAGLTLAKALEADASLAPRLQTALAEAAPDSAEAELALINAVMIPKKTARAEPVSAETEPVVMVDKIDVGEITEGAIRLSGPGVTPAFRAALLDWLQRR